MPDNMNEFDGPGPTEPQVNTRSETEPQSVVRLVYRSRLEGPSSNPFMAALGEQLAQRGIAVVETKISPEAYDEAFNSPYREIPEVDIPRPSTDHLKAPVAPRNSTAKAEAAYDKAYRAYDRAYQAITDPYYKALGEAKKQRQAQIELRQKAKLAKLFGPLEGVVITDRTLYREVEEFSPEEPINAYDVAIDSKEKGTYVYGKGEAALPVLKESLTEILEEVKQAGKDVKVIPYDLDVHLFDGPDGGKRVYERFLKETFGIELAFREDDENTVYLVDHHLGQRAAQSTVGNHEVILICPCCIGLPLNIDVFTSNGYKMFPVKYKRELTGAVDALVKAIKAKREKIATNPAPAKIIPELPDTEAATGVHTQIIEASETPVEPAPVRVEPEIRAESEVAEPTVVEALPEQIATEAPVEAETAEPEKVDLPVVVAYTKGNEQMQRYIKLLKPRVTNLRVVEIPAEVEQAVGEYLISLPDRDDKRGRSRFFSELKKFYKKVLEAYVGDIPPIMVTDWLMTNAVNEAANIKDGFGPINPLHLTPPVGPDGKYVKYGSDDDYFLAEIERTAKWGGMLKKEVA